MKLNKSEVNALLGEMQKAHEHKYPEPKVTPHTRATLRAEAQNWARKFGQMPKAIKEHISYNEDLLKTESLYKALVQDFKDNQPPRPKFNTEQCRRDIILMAHDCLSMTELMRKLKLK